jgi:hypothetical protein
MKEYEPHLWEAPDGELHAIFYHKPNDPQGCALELSRRLDIEALQDDTDVERLIMDKGAAAVETLIPIPNTTDVLGVLKGEVDLNPSYKRLGECGIEEAQMVKDFLDNYSDLLRREEEITRKYF